MTVDPTTGGYWLVATDGGIFSYNAPFLGSTGSIALNKPVVGMAAASDGSGYWLVATDRGIFAYRGPLLGIHRLHPSEPARRRNGLRWSDHWLLDLASDGGIFAYNSPFYGSNREHRLESAHRRHGGHRKRERVSLRRR